VDAKKKESVWIPSRAGRMEKRIIRLKKRWNKAEKKIEKKTQLVLELKAGVEDIFCETTAMEDEKISGFQDIIDSWKEKVETKSNIIVELEEMMDKKKSQVDALNCLIKDLKNETCSDEDSDYYYGDDAVYDADDANIDAA